MGYRLDSHYRFVCTLSRGYLGDIFKLLADMPWDSKIRVTDADAGDPDRSSWALLALEFSAGFDAGYRSPTLDWLEAFVQAERRRQDEGQVTHIECALFAGCPDDDHTLIFGVPRWEVVVDTLSAGSAAEDE